MDWWIDLAGYSTSWLSCRLMTITEGYVRFYTGSQTELTRPTEPLLLGESTPYLVSQCNVFHLTLFPKACTTTESTTIVSSNAVQCRMGFPWSRWHSTHAKYAARIVRVNLIRSQILSTSIYDRYDKTAERGNTSILFQGRWLFDLCLTL